MKRVMRRDKAAGRGYITLPLCVATCKNTLKTHQKHPKHHPQIDFLAFWQLFQQCLLSRSSTNQNTSLANDALGGQFLKNNKNKMLFDASDRNRCEDKDMNFSVIPPRLVPDGHFQEEHNTAEIELTEDGSVGGAVLGFTSTARLLTEEPAMFQHCPNEAKFRVYVVLLKLNDGNFLWEVRQLPEGNSAYPDSSLEAIQRTQLIALTKAAAFPRCVGLPRRIVCNQMDPKYYERPQLPCQLECEIQDSFNLAGQFRKDLLRALLNPNKVAEPPAASNSTNKDSKVPSPTSFSSKLLFPKPAPRGYITLPLWVATCKNTPKHPASPCSHDLSSIN